MWMLVGTLAVDGWAVKNHVIASRCYASEALCPNSTYSICCGFVVQQVVQQIHDKSIAYNKSTTSRHVEMLWICCTTNPQQIHDKSTTNRNVVQQIHDKSIAYNKSTTSRHVEMLWICCTTIPSPQQIHNKSKQWSLDSICCGLVVASQPIRELMLMTCIYCGWAGASVTQEL